MIVMSVNSKQLMDCKVIFVGKKGNDKFCKKMQVVDENLFCV